MRANADWGEKEERLAVPGDPRGGVERRKVEKR